MALQAGTKVRILRGSSKGGQGIIEQERDGFFFLKGDETPYSKHMLQELPR